MITLRTQTTDSERHTTKVYFLLYGSKELPILKESAESIVKSKKKESKQTKRLLLLLGGGSSFLQTLKTV